MGKPKSINAKDAADAYKKGQAAARAEADRRKGTPAPAPAGNDDAR
ncbi:hypothetical protein ACIRQP_14905 [Streptomyces sp. NPDC102274]